MKNFPSVCVCLTSLTLTFGLVSLSALRADPLVVIENPTQATQGKPTLTLTENKRTQTVAADGRDLAIEGDGNKITVTGDCHALTVNGNKNEISLGAVGAISTPGNGNRVTWVKAVGGEKPQITNLGSGNVLGVRAD